MPALAFLDVVIDVLEHVAVPVSWIWLAVAFVVGAGQITKDVNNSTKPNEYGATHTHPLKGHAHLLVVAVSLKVIDLMAKRLNGRVHH
jgi:hypothetical protein